MSKTILIPTPLRPYANQQESLATQTLSIDAAMQELVHEFPKLNQYLYDNENKLRKFINVFVNGKDIRDLEGVDTPLADGDEVALVPAIAGGIA